MSADRSIKRLFLLNMIFHNNNSHLFIHFLGYNKQTNKKKKKSTTTFKKVWLVTWHRNQNKYLFFYHSIWKWQKSKQYRLGRVKMLAEVALWLHWEVKISCWIVGCIWVTKTTENFLISRTCRKLGHIHRILIVSLYRIFISVSENFFIFIYWNELFYMVFYFIDF